MNRRRFITAMAMVPVSAVLASCAQPQVPATSTQSASAPKSTAATAPKAGVTEAQATQGKKGGIFKAAVSAQAPTLDTMTSLAAAVVQPTMYIFEQLLAFGEDYTVQPMLAEKYEVSQDGLTYTFTLRKGVKFHNGKEMTSEDVVASMNRYLKVGARGAQFANLDTVSANGPSTVVFKMKKVTGSFLYSMAYHVGGPAVMPKEVVDKIGTGKPTNADIIGTGPYKLVDYKPDTGIILKRYDDYRPVDAPQTGLAGAKVSYFDEIHIIPVSETGARIAGLETGQYDYAEGVPASEYDRLSAKSDIKVEVMKPYSAYMLLFNHADPISGNVKFRHAVLAALDMDAIGLAVANGRSEFYGVDPSIYARTSPFYYGDDPQAKALYNQKNGEKAKQLLQEAGYKGEEVIIVTNRDYDYMYKSMLSVGDQLKKNAGMNVKVEVLDWPGQRAKWEQKTGWQMSTTGYISQFLYAHDALSGFWDSRSTGSAERAFYSNPEMDAAWDAVAAAVTVDARRVALQKVQQVFYKDLPNIKMAEGVSMVALRSNIKGFKIWASPYRFWGVWRE